MTGFRDSFAGGSISAPAWLVVLAGATVVLSGLSYFVWRIRKARRAPRLSRPSVKRG